jgi:hypothetical protein
MSRCTCYDEFDDYCAVHATCDDDCRALRAPTTEDEVTAAMVHWRDHSNLGGCSHGN